MKTNNKLIRVSLGILITIGMMLSLIISPQVKAADEGFSFAVSPMKEKIVLNPGEKYTSSLKVYIPSDYNADVRYQIGVEDYFVDENYNNIFSGCGEYCEMKNWITIDSRKEGVLSPGEKVTIEYTISVPKNAAGGGQYASIMVQGDKWTGESEEEQDSSDNADVTSTIKEVRKIAYTIYAEVAGDVEKNGEIIDINVPSFLLSGNITGQSSIKNTGNVHGDASYNLQVFPLFSDEEVYTNEEDPATRTILPDRTLYHELAWEKTPSIGIFNVVYTVEFEGVTAQAKKMVIKCPIWLLFIIIFAIVAAIIYFVSRARARRAERRAAE